MKLVPRSKWGAKPPLHDLVWVPGAEGVKVHWEGEDGVPVSMAAPDQHPKCAGHVRAIQASHMANTQEGYSDIAYNFVVCPHGDVFEGRGLHYRTGANGSRSLNERHYAVMAMLCEDGLDTPPPAMLVGLADAIDHIRANGGAGDEVEGHRDGYATECPGPKLYAWVQAGARRPDVDDDDPDVPPAPPFPGRRYFVKGANNGFALQLQTWLDKGKWGPPYRVGPSRQMTDLDIRKVAALQSHYLSELGPADGLTGPKTWRYAYEVAHGLRNR